MDQPNFQELLRIVNEGAEEDKRNCSLGLFVSEYLRDEDDVEKATNEVEELIVKKPVVNSTKKVGRNDPCPCGSGKKYKKCCGANTVGDDE